MRSAGAIPINHGIVKPCWGGPNSGALRTCNPVGETRDILCASHRPGHDLDAGDSISRRHVGRGGRTAGISAAFSGRRRGRARARGSVGDDASRPAARRCARPARPRRTSSPSASPISARPRCCGSARPAAPIHRAIVWQDRRTADFCARLKAAGHEALFAAQDRTSARSVFFRHQTRLAAAQRRRTPRPRRARRTRLRHGRYVFAVAPDRRQSPRHRCDQRLAHAAVRHPRRPLGRRACWRSSTCPRPCCRRCSIRPPPSASTDPELFGAAIPIYGIAGDQQAALIGQACFTPGMVKVDLRHRLLRVAQYRRDAGRFEQQLADHHRLSARRRAHAMRSKARSSSPAPRCNGCATACASSQSADETGALAQPRRPDAGRLFWSRPSSGSARPIGGRTCAARCSA